MSAKEHKKKKAKMAQAQSTPEAETTKEGKERRRGKYTGYRSDWKKAYVTLREGEKMIEYGENM